MGAGAGAGDHMHPGGLRELVSSHRQVHARAQARTADSRDATNAEVVASQKGQSVPSIPVRRTPRPPNQQTRQGGIASAYGATNRPTARPRPGARMKKK